MSPTDPPVHDSRPSLWRDRAFAGMTATQFLGAFNDNVFKQLVLLICLDYAVLQDLKGDPYQPWAQGLFALPFVLISGFAGWLADRNSKRAIIVCSKIAEFGVMLAGLAAFAALAFGSPELLFALLGILFFMGMQSAFFGPSKYGILPELFRADDLPAANGVIQMTTFLAIIGGTAVCGFLKTTLQTNGALWMISLVCCLIAVIGTATSITIRKTPIAEPGLPFHLEALAVDRTTLRMIRQTPLLRGALLATVLFWFLGGVTLPAVNTLGKNQLALSEDLGDTVASVLAACMGLGIAFGCLIAGAASRHRVSFRLVRLGSSGMLLVFSLLAAVPYVGLSGKTSAIIAGILLIALGLCAGVYAVPLQVVLQACPPADQKGRMIGTMNLCTWLGILVSAMFYGICAALFSREQISLTFAVLALLTLPVLLFYHPDDQDLSQFDQSPAVPEIR